MILGSKSFAHLRAVFEEYGKVSKNDIEKALKSEMSGDLLKSMLSIGELQSSFWRSIHIY